MIPDNSNNISAFEIKGFLTGRYNHSCDIFNRQYNDCIGLMSEENVHDLRISIRRLIAFLSLQKSIFSSGYYKKLIKELRSLLKEFSLIRDVQVQLLNIKDLRHDNKFLNKYFYYLLRLEESEVKRMSEFIKNHSSDDINSGLFFLQNDFKIKFSVHDGLIKDLSHRLAHTFEKVRLRNDTIFTDKPETFHKVRIAFKKFRYAILSQIREHPP